MAKKSGASPSSGMQILGIMGGVMLMIAAWRFPVPLPYIAPHPTTLLSLIAVLFGIILGPRRGTLIVALYVLAVIINLPPLVWHAPPETAAFLSLPTNGLILGLIFAALVAGLLTPQGAQSNPSRLALGAILGHLAYLIVGIAWLTRFGPLPQAASAVIQSQMAAVLVKSAAAFGIALAAGRVIKG